MDNKREMIKEWLGTGSLNIFGYPFAGKDTQGLKLADMFGGVMISSGDMLRHSQDNKKLQQLLAAGEIIPSDMFENIVLPYFSDPQFQDKPLILSEVGRMEGEQQVVLRAAADAHHPVKAMVLLKLTDEEVFNRFESAKQIQDRGSRADDRKEVLRTRLDNYKTKVVPVINWYRENDLLIEVDGSLPREEVTNAILDNLARLSST